MLVPAGRGRKAAAADEDSWDWQHSRQRVLLAVRELLLLDLKALFRGVAAAEQLINLAMELVSSDCWCTRPTNILLQPFMIDILLLRGRHS